MDYEKAYKNALQLARSYYDKGTNEFLDTIFPELTESEDERIREDIMEAVENWLRNVVRPLILKKQKEQNAEPFSCGHENGLSEKPNNQWSEEDENTLRAIHRLIGLGYSEKIMDAQTTTDMREWVNNHFRPQQKQEWSEEDKKMLDECVIALSNWRDAVSNYGHEVAPCQRLIDWLKSLRPQPHWKPSEEQMNYLRAEVSEAKRKHEASVSGYTPARILESLYNDLKKLM